MRFKRRIATITLIAFIVSVLLPFMATYNVAQASTAEPSGVESIFGDKILLCTAEGFKWVSLTDLQSGKEQPAEHPQFECPLCYVAASGANNVFPAISAELENSPTARQRTLRFAATPPIAAQCLEHSRNSRAPPYSIIA